jgi:hypothetical protein
VGSHWRLSNFTNAVGIQVGLLYYRILPMDAAALRAVWNRQSYHEASTMCVLLNSQFTIMVCYY